jgi:hypothetical protein
MRPVGRHLRVRVRVRNRILEILMLIRTPNIVLHRAAKGAYVCQHEEFLHPRETGNYTYYTTTGACETNHRQ